MIVHHEQWAFNSRGWNGSLCQPNYNIRKHSLTPCFTILLDDFNCPLVKQYSGYFTPWMQTWWWGNSTRAKILKMFVSSVGSIQKQLAKWCFVSGATNYRIERIRKPKKTPPKKTDYIKKALHMKRLQWQNTPFLELTLAMFKQLI